MRRGGDGTDRTVMVSQPAFTPGGRAWRPFTFKGLERVTQAQVILTDKLEWLVPSASAKGQVSAAVTARLKELFDVDAELLVDSVHTIRPQDLRRHVADPTFFATLAPLPHKTRGFMEVELGLAHMAIDMLLGDEQTVVVVQFKCVLGQHSGFIRLFIPSTVLNLASPPDLAPEARTRRRQRIGRHVQRLTGVKAFLRAEIGRAEVGARDLASLRQGDVVLCDDLAVRTDRGESGRAELRVGMGLVGRMDAEVFVEEGHYKARVQGFVFGEPARQNPPLEDAAEGLAGGTDDADMDLQDGPMGDEDNTNPSGSRHLSERMPVDETIGEGSELLNDIPLQIAVELARVPVTAEQVVSLRVGQVVDLNRVPGEPVELSVNGKVVARGELVEVEGHLGVRILSMAS